MELSLRYTLVTPWKEFNSSMNEDLDLTSTWKLSLIMGL
jgi:hypothetical protein